MLVSSLLFLEASFADREIHRRAVRTLTVTLAIFLTKGMARAAAGEKSVANKMFSNRVRVLAVAAFMRLFPPSEHPPWTKFWSL
jgi:hypothetical protein